MKKREGLLIILSLLVLFWLHLELLLFPILIVIVVLMALMTKHSKSIYQNYSVYSRVILIGSYYLYSLACIAYLLNTGLMIRLIKLITFISLGAVIMAMLNLKVNFFSIGKEENRNLIKQLYFEFNLIVLLLIVALL